jgi:hypothetical protein
VFIAGTTTTPTVSTPFQGLAHGASGRNILHAAHKIMQARRGITERTPNMSEKHDKNTSTRGHSAPRAMRKGKWV